MTEKEFCTRLAKCFEDIDANIVNLSGDFMWLIKCGGINAECGYYPKYLLEHNATAEALLQYYGKRITDAITGCGAVGWYKCAEDDDCIQEQMRKTLKKFEK